MFLNQWIRVIFNNNTVLSDLSIGLSNREAQTIDIVYNQDEILVGQYYPFNNLFAEVSTANDVASVISAQYWTGRDWTSCIDMLDGTAVGGKTLSRSGMIQYSPDVHNSWVNTSDTRTENTNIGITSLAILDLYWMKLKFSASLKATTAIKSLSYAFTNDRMLTALDPEVAQYLTSWGGVGKTDWLEQILIASQQVVMDLKSKGLIVAPGNILRFDDVSMACAWRTLINIYTMLGENMKAKRDIAIQEYNKALDIKRFSFDKNSDALLTRSELVSTITAGVR